MWVIKISEVLIDMREDKHYLQIHSTKKKEMKDQPKIIFLFNEYVQ